MLSQYSSLPLPAQYSLYVKNQLHLSWLLSNRFLFFVPEEINDLDTYKRMTKDWIEVKKLLDEHLSILHETFVETKHGILHRKYIEEDAKYFKLKACAYDYLLALQKFQSQREDLAENELSSFLKRGPIFHATCLYGSLEVDSKYNSYFTRYTLTL